MFMQVSPLEVSAPTRFLVYLCRQPLNNPGLAALAGILVGAGTRIGSGCTSGHGVCGIGRRSPRSLAATMVFISAGIATVYLTRHLMG